MKMLVGSGWSDAADGSTMEIINPATGQVIDTVPVAGPEYVQRAVATAAAAQPAWAARTVRERTTILRRFIDLVHRDRRSLGETLSRESGKPYETEGVWEFDAVAYVFDAVCEVAKHHYGKTMPIGTESDYDRDIQFTLHEPLGVIAAIVPFNFPPAIWCYKAAGALAAGNSIVVKAPDQDPLALLRCHELLLEAGVPAEVIQIVTGPGEITGAALAADPRIALISFTGSTQAGAKIARAAAPHFTQTQFEMGGNDPFIVCADADLDLAIAESANKVRNSGQACTAPKRFLIHNSLREEFTDRLINEYLKKTVMGDPFSAETTMGPLITEAAARRVEAQVEEILDSGANLAYGGERTGAFYSPTVVTDVPLNAAVMTDTEIFGPVWPIIGFDSVDEAIKLSNSSQYGLGGSVFTSNMQTAFEVTSTVHTGHMVVNGTGYIRAAELPFGGGRKMSGNSRESIATIMDDMTQQKSVILRNIL